MAPSFVKGEVGLVMRSKEHVRHPAQQGRTIMARQLIIAAGAWSHRLARQLGDAIPLETERGYNTTLPVGAFDLKRQLIFSGHGFVVTPLETGLRIGGAVELGGLDLPPNYTRSEAMLTKAKSFMPGLDDRAAGSGWVIRPSLPDLSPVIGRARTSRQCVSMLLATAISALTQSPATGA